MQVTNLRRQTIRASSVLLCGLSFYVLAGWLIASPSMVRVVPGSVAMSINTALMFLMSGISIELFRRQKAPAVLLLLSCLITLLSSLILVQHVFGVDLMIDMAAVHNALGDGHVKPGRTSPNACFGFLCAGLALLFTRSAPGHALRKVALVLALLTLFVGVAGFVGYLVGLDAMYRIASLNRMALFTALGMSTLGLGLWAIHSTAVEARADGVHDEARRITKLAAILLVVFAFATSLSSFALLRGSFEKSAAQHLADSARTASVGIGALLRDAGLLSDSMAQRSSLVAAVTELAARRGDPEALAQVATAAAAFKDAGFSATTISIDGAVVYRTGDSSGLPAGAIALGGSADSAILYWKEGFHARSTHMIHYGAGQVFAIVTDRALPSLDNLADAHTRFSDATDFILCGQAAEHIHCFPSRFDENGFSLPLREPGRPTLPIRLALLGESGATTLKDARGLAVLEGYAPLGPYPLGVIVKTEVSELYLPLRDKLHLVLAAFAFFVIAGTLLLRVWLQPLILRIITERERIKSILDNSNDAFIAIGPDGRVTDWNAQAERTLGIKDEQALGKDLAELIIPERYRQAHNAGFARFLRGETGPAMNKRVELPARHQSGREIPVEISVTTLAHINGMGASAFLRDLTERKAAEAVAAEQAHEIEQARLALSRSQRLEAVGKLTGGIAHDFNNVLQIVRGNLELISQENEPGSIAQRVHSAVAAVDRGAKLSSQLLAFARRQPLQPQATNLGRVVLSMEEMLQRALGDAIDIEVVVSGSLWNALVDPNQLEHVIVNLAINGRDAMEGRGKLTLEVFNAELDDEYVRAEPGLEPGQFVVLAISDTGCGMSRAVMEKAFEPFFTTKPEGQGTGLGLSMAYGFCKQSRGHIMLYSEPDEGTTARLYLPRTTAAEPARPEGGSRAVERGTETVLVVEDDLAVQSTAVQTLSGLGYTVMQADHAAQALALLEAGHHVDLLFTDVVMPGTLRSPELARLARALLPDLRVLFTSGYTQNAIVHGGRLDPGVELLSKPYRRDQLAAKVRAVLDAPRAAQPIAPAMAAREPMIAFVEDNEDFRMIGVELLGLLGWKSACFSNGEDALAALKSGRFNILLTDVGLPGMSGVQLAKLAKEGQPAIGIILATGFGDALQERPDFSHLILAKPFTVEHLRASVESLMQ